MEQHFPQVEEGQEVTPAMDDYLMKCCDCGLVHRIKFRAIEVVRHMDGGDFGYEVLDPEKFRVEMTVWRE